MIIRCAALIAVVVLGAPVLAGEAGVAPVDFALAPGGERPRVGGAGGFGGRFGFGMEDPELAELTLDVLLLRAINEMQLTRGQAERMVPVLQRAVQLRHRAVEQTKQVLRQVREQLLRSTEPGIGGGDPLARVQGIQQEAEQAAEQARQTLAQTLNARQMQILQRVLQMGMPGGPEFGPPPGPAPMGPGGPQRPGVGGSAGMLPRPGGGFSPLILERLAVLLQEKARYLPR